MTRFPPAGLMVAPVAVQVASSKKAKTTALGNRVSPGSMFEPILPQARLMGSQDRTVLRTDQGRQRQASVADHSR